MSSSNISDSMKELSIDSSDQAARRTIKAKPVAESWEEDEDDESDGSGNSDPVSSIIRPKSQPGHARNTSDGPSAPPPTPASPRQRTQQNSRPNFDFTAHLLNGDASVQQREKGSVSSVRPEKTVSTASRMIAGALGVKAPKRTDEQRAYDRAARDNEQRRREKEREERKLEEERKEKAKREIWDG